VIMHYPADNKERCESGLDSAGLAYGAVAGRSEHGNEPWISIKLRQFPDQLSDCKFLR